MRAHVVCLILFDFSTFLSLLSIFSLIVLSFPLAINYIFHDVVDKIPCALQPMRTWALLPSTILSPVMSPTTTTSRRRLNRALGENGSLNDLEYDDVTIGKALSSPLFTQEREDDASRRRAFHSQGQGLSSCRRLSVIEREDPLWNRFDSQISSGREIPSHSSESEQIKILLERQREQKQRFENMTSRPIMTEEAFKN